MSDADSVSTLRQHPGIAEKIGYLMGDYAALEYGLFVVYAFIAAAGKDEISEADVLASFSKFYKLRSINNKTGLVLDAAKPIVDPVRYRALVRACRRIKGAANRRTEVAHCVFTRAAPGSPIMRLSTSRSDPTFEPLDERYFERTVAQFQILMQDLLILATFVAMTQQRMMSLLRALPLPPNTPFPEEAVAPPAHPEPHAEAFVKDSVIRLGLQPLYKD